ncbi:MAG: alpha/beta fold hydrolase [Acidimicrobiales bacterium]
MSTPFLVSRGDTNLVGDIWPGDGSTVLLLHAGVADRRSWDLVAPEVSKHATVASYDRRGFGDSAPGTTSFTHLQDLRSVLDHLQIEKAWLVGSSAGGKLALDAALSMPERVAGLVLLSPAASGAPLPASEIIEPELLRLDEQIGEADERGDLDGVNRLEIHLWLDGPREREGRIVGESRELALDMNRIALANGVSESSDDVIDAWSRLKEVGVPTTVACGAFDANHILVRSEELGQRIPMARYLVLDGMAHLPYLEDPFAVAELIIGAITGPPQLTSAR